MATDQLPICKQPAGLTDVEMRYCPGCTHGTAHRMVAEVIEELDIRQRTVAIATVGCSVYMYEYINTDAIQAAHGRGPAVATGVKRVQPDSIVFTYQGDGDLASIGMAEIVHAASRGENITVVFINNAVFGMTQGQMAPTTLVGQKTTTTPLGRNPEHEGHPIRVCELLDTLEAPAFIAREALSTPGHLRRAKKAIRRAFETQVAGLGFSIVELLSTCSVWWGMTPVESIAHVDGAMTEQFPLNTFRDRLSEQQI